MNSKNQWARISGVLYLLMVVTYGFSLGYVPGRFLIEDDPAATIAAIRAAELLFRFGVVVGMIACVVYTLQVLALYKLLGEVNTAAGAVFVAISLAHLPLFFIGYVDELRLLSLLKEGGHAAALSSDQLHTHVAMVVDSFHSSVRVNIFIMAMWLLPFGYLVFRCGFLPRLLGVLLVINSVPYFISFFRIILAPTFEMPDVIDYLTAPMMIGEFATCLWLLIMGARKSFARADSASASLASG